MLTIRLQRLGKKNYPTYRFIISEKTRDTQGTFLETLGNFDPHKKETGLVLDAERVKYWLGKGAQTSNTVHNILMKAGIITDGKKMKSVYISKTRAVKLVEKKKVVAEPKAAAEPKMEVKPEPAAEVQPEAPVAPETPVVPETPTTPTEPQTAEPK
ncbi:MAG: 30S ribosomal protein S16 [Patescibacteria group bacterium]